MDPKEEIWNLKKKLVLAKLRAAYWRALTCRFTEDEMFQKLREGHLYEPESPMCQLDATLFEYRDKIARLGGTFEPTLEEHEEDAEQTIKERGAS